ncbi:MAG: prolipoprotein diacylglyceryl transferase [Deferribacterales bacterium]|nr:prolipoprotein diacylglyceryl transferase [Deferribacterales bacterium]
MEIIIFLSAYICFLGFFTYFGIKFFPKENYQVLCIIPVKKYKNGKWYGLNITYYGLISAISYTFAVFTFLILTKSYSIKIQIIVISAILILISCMPAARFMARIIEKKKNTFTISGAAFIGTLLSPIIFFATSYLFTLDLNFARKIAFILLSALSVSYILGEGVGRLACISFGCCYGKKVDEYHGVFKNFFNKFNTVFEGKTKKASYEGGCENIKTIPVQSLSSIIYNTTGLIGIILFSLGYIKTCFVLTVVVANLWRFVTEFLRNDHRGTIKKYSNYQYFSFITIFYAFLIVLIFNVDIDKNGIFFDIKSGFNEIKNFWITTFLLSIFVVSFIYTGISKVTYAKLEIEVFSKNI